MIRNAVSIHFDHSICGFYFVIHASKNVHQNVERGVIAAVNHYVCQCEINPNTRLVVASVTKVHQQSQRLSDEKIITHKQKWSLVVYAL